MAIVPTFEWDLFISYAHVDNLQIADEDRGWVTDFHDTLFKRLWQELRQKPAIWRDERGLDGRRADPAIAAALTRSAVLVVVLSPAFVESAYCLAEARDFCAQRHPAFDLLVQGFSRIVVVALPTTGRGALPPQVAAAPVVEFSSADPATGACTRFNKPRRSDPDPYWDRMDRVVRHLPRSCRRCNVDQRRTRGRTSAADGGSHLPVYLAEATDDLQNERGEVLAILQRGSRRAGPSVEPPRSILQAVSVRAACRDWLARARSSVHLINATAGRSWGDAEMPLAQMELEQALQRPELERPLRVDSAGVEPEAATDPAYRKFLTHSKPEPSRCGLASARRKCSRCRSIASSPARRPAVRAPAGGLARSATETAGRRCSCTSPIGPATACRVQPHRALARRRYAVAHLDHASQGGDVLERHQANLRFCDGFVVLYGHEAIPWAEHVALEAWMLSRERRRPRRLGMIAEDDEAGAHFGLVDDDRVVPITARPIRRTSSASTRSSRRSRTRTRGFREMSDGPPSTGCGDSKSRKRALLRPGRETYDVLRRLRSMHFVAVLGPSGCGKSSLIRAGVLAALQSGLHGRNRAVANC